VLTVNDLDLLRTMRTDAPVPDRHRLDTGRERLLTTIESPHAGWRAARPRRRLGRARGLLFAGGAAAVAAAVAVTVAAQTGTRPATLHTSPAANLAKYADPLVERAAFGWLPNGLRANGYVADHQEQRYLQVTAQNARSSVTLTAYAPGKEPMLPHLPGGVPGRRIPAAPVNGHSAYWIFTPDASGQSSFELRWKYAANSWADLEGVGLHGSSAELTAMAYRVARSATFGGTRPIAMPLHVGGVPGGLTPKRTVLNNGAHGQVSAILEYIVTVPTSDLSVSIVKSSGGPRRPAPNVRVDGHPAIQRPGILYVFGVNGFDVQIDASGSILAKLNRTGGLIGLFHQITILGGDPANWTTIPVN
jgi:hypothetical protein